MCEKDICIKINIIILYRIENLLLFVYNSNIINVIELLLNMGDLYEK